MIGDNKSQLHGRASAEARAADISLHYKTAHSLANSNAHLIFLFEKMRCAGAHLIFLLKK